MPQIRKDERNKRLFLLRHKHKWTLYRLAKEFGISHVRAREIYLEELSTRSN